MERTESIKLLAIDDKPDNLITLSAVVQDALPRTRVFTATNGLAGIELAVTENPDVILLDIVMPGMDGFEVCRRLKNKERLKDTPVVFITALKTDAANRVMALEVGAEGFLTKPLEPTELIAQIRAMVKVKVANRNQRMEKEQLETLVAERTRELHESERLIRSTIDSLAAHIAILDASGVILSVNKAWRRFAELNSARGSVCEGANYLAACDAVQDDHQGFAQEFATAIRRVLSGVEQEYALEYPCHSPDEQRWFLGRVTRFVDEGPPRVVVAHENITELKRAEEEKRALNTQLQQAQKLESIGTLAGGIAHDFNNILGAIIGYSEMIHDDLPPGSPSVHHINEVLKASHRAKALVKQILAFSRQAECQKIPMQPAIIVKEVIALLRSSLPTTIAIEQDIDNDTEMVLADPTQIHQVVMNLATNAFHAMEVKGGRLTIGLTKKALSQAELATEPDLQPGTFVQLSIRDTGEGIPPEIRERIFDPFFSTKDVGKGTGLGLSMVYSIVKSCHGAICCESRLGKGTEFRILLPVLEGYALQDNGSTDFSPHGKEHILLIDDEEILVDLGQTMLERLGYHVTATTSSFDALAKFKNQPNSFDLIITDQTMPDMTGVDLAQRILRIRPQMPIILCTGYSNQINEETAKAAGIRGFAFKPLAKKDLGELIRRVLDGINP